MKEQFACLDRRRALGSSGGQHELVEDREGLPSVGATKFFSKLARLLASRSASKPTTDLTTTFGERHTHAFPMGEGDVGVEIAFLEPFYAVCSLLLDALSDFFVGWLGHPSYDCVD